MTEILDMDLAMQRCAVPIRRSLGEDIDITPTHVIAYLHALEDFIAKLGEKEKTDGR